MNALTGRQRVVADAAARGLSIELVERAPAGSLVESAELLGIDPRQIVKSLVVRLHTPEGAPAAYLFALIPGDRSISWPKLRAVVGVNKLSLPSPELALEATGYERGTITPIGAHGNWPVYADSSISGTRAALGAGDHGLGLFVQADELIRAFSARVADISQS